MTDILATSVYMTRAEVQRLQQMAASLGYYISRGPGTGIIGNVSALMRAIANGEETIAQEEEPNG